MEDDFDWDAQEVSLDSIIDLEIGDWFSTDQWDDCWYEFNGLAPYEKFILGRAARKYDRMILILSLPMNLGEIEHHTNFRVKKRLFSTKLYSPEQSGDTEDDI